MKKTILIVGITSFVGSNLALVLAEKYRVVGTYHSPREALPSSLALLPCNVLKKDEIKRALAYFKPDYVIYAVGLSSLTEAKGNYQEAEKLNSQGATNCLALAERMGALFIYLSSAYVLSGEDKLFKEADTPSPISDYGTSVANAEFLIQRTSLHYLILRCPVLYGLGYSSTKSNLLELLERSVFEQRPLKLDDFVKVGFLDVQLVARFMMVLLEKNIVNRLVHISSKDHLTTFEFAKKYAEVFKSTSSYFQGENASDVFDNKKKNSSLSFRMDVTNTESRVGIKMPTIEESLEFSYRRFSGKSS